MIILVGGVKGGCGKTTLATNLVAALAARGADVVLVDADSQGSAADWAAVRGEIDAPTVAAVRLSGRAVATQTRDLAGRYGMVMIDAGGRDSIELRAAMTVADLLLVPVQASQFDVWAIEPLAEIIEQAQVINPNLVARAVIWRASTHHSSTEASEAREVLTDFPVIQLAQTQVKDRVAFRRAARSGLGVTESGEDPKAAQEVEALISEVIKK